MTKNLVEIGCSKVVSDLHNFLMSGTKLDIYEPLPRNIANIKEHYKDYPNVNVYPLAVWKESGTVKMYDLGDLSYIEGAPAPALGFNYQPNADDVVEVGAVTMDQIDDGLIDILDVDIEGCEWYALEKLISRPEILVIKTGDDENPHMKEINEWLKGNGYVKFGYVDQKSFYKRKYPRLSTRTLPEAS